MISSWKKHNQRAKEYRIRAINARKKAARARTDLKQTTQRTIGNAGAISWAIAAGMLVGIGRKKIAMSGGRLVKAALLSGTVTRLAQRSLLSDKQTETGPVH